MITYREPPTQRPPIHHVCGRNRALCRPGHATRWCARHLRGQGSLTHRRRPCGKRGRRRCRFPGIPAHGNARSASEAPRDGEVRARTAVRCELRQSSKTPAGFQRDHGGADVPNSESIGCTVIGRLVGSNAARTSWGARALYSNSMEATNASSMDSNSSASSVG